MSESWAWSDHIPSGGEGMDGYGYVACSCGWIEGKTGWVEHIRAMGADDLGAAPLDVERLAEAIYYHDPLYQLNPREPDSRTRAAAILAALDAAPREDPSEARDSLAAAWAEAEAALPEPGYISLSGPFGVTDQGPYDDHYNVVAYSHRERREALPDQAIYPIGRGVGPTPATALRAFAAKPKERMG